MTTTTADVLVIGGGPAGAAAASRLAAKGLRVVVCERRAPPRHQVCGEFVSATAAAELADLGAPPERLGARRITRTRIFSRGASVATRLPFDGYGLSRERLDRHLLEVATRRGATLREGTGVRAIERARGVWSAALGDGDRIESGAVVLATGKHDLRGRARPMGGVPPMVAFKMHWRLRPDQAVALEDAVELFLLDGGYAGLQLIESGIANLCAVVASPNVRGGGDAWARALSHLLRHAPALEARLCDARPLWSRPASIARIPYGYLCPTGGGAEGLYPVGDQAAVIPSFAGEGIAIALRSAGIAADAVVAGRAPRHYAAAIRGDIGGPVRRARLVEAVARRLPLRGLGAVPAAVPLLARLTRLPQRAAHLPDPGALATLAVL